MFGQTKELEYANLRVFFKETYLHKLNTYERAKVDEIMGKSLVAWSSELPIDVRLDCIDPKNEKKLREALVGVRLVFVCSLAAKIHAEFAPKCKWSKTWPMLLNQRRVPKYIVARTCPITGNALVWPAKFETCNHIECFEYDTKDLLKICPFCGRKKTTVVLDMTLKVVLEHVPETSDLIVLKQNFSWTHTTSPEAYTDLMPFYKGISAEDTYLPNTIYNNH